MREAERKPSRTVCRVGSLRETDRSQHRVGRRCHAGTQQGAEEDRAAEQAAAVHVFTDETRSPNGKIELPGVLSLLGKLIDITDAGDGGETTANPANENAEAGAE